MTYLTDLADFVYSTINSVPREAWLIIAIVAGILSAMLMHRIRAGIVTALVLVLFLPAPVSVGALDHVNIEQAPTIVRYFETPCELNARRTYGVPPLTLDQSRGLIAWQRQHVGTPEGAEYNAAATACSSVPDFDWGQRVLVFTEVSS